MKHAEGMVVLVQGPTASGKTSLAIALAKALKTEIISADSRQFYREMSIGTAKPSSSELQEVKHHFIDSHSIHYELSAQQYAHEAKNVLERLRTENGSVVIVGGSGLFVDALTYGLDEIPHYRLLQAKWNKIYQIEGIFILQQKIKELDPVYADFVDLHNPIRLIRALEVCEGSGKPYSEWRIGKNTIHYPVKRFYINWRREDIYQRINTRVDQMIEHGLFDEAKNLFAQRHLKALNTVGYQEFFDYWDGIYPLENAISKIKQHTRNYAKRQLTWLKKYDDLIELNPYSAVSCLDQALSLIKTDQ